MVDYKKEDLKKMQVKDTAMGVKKKGNKYHVPKKVDNVAKFNQKYKDSKSVIEGIIKAANKAKKNLALTGVKPGEKPSGPPPKDVHGNDIISSRQAAHRAKRGIKKTMESFNHLRLESILLETFAKTYLNEGRDNTDTDNDSISNAGGDSGAYAKLKAAKDAKAGVGDERQKAKKDMHGAADRLGVKPNSKGNITRGAFRKTALGHPKAGIGQKAGPKDPKSGPYGKAGTAKPPLTKAQIDGSGVGGKPGEAATKAKYAKIDKVPSIDPKADRRKALAQKIAAMRKPS